MRSVLNIDDDGDVLHGTHQHLMFSPGVKLHLEDGRGEAKPLVALAGHDVPHGDVVVGRRADQFAARAAPTEKGNKFIKESCIS